MGNLTVNLLKATNLVAADRSGASDPYFVFFVNGKEVYKSEVVKKSLNPEYNETFAVPIVSLLLVRTHCPFFICGHSQLTTLFFLFDNQASRAEDRLSFEVFDWNQVQAAKSLGAAAIDLKNLQLVLPNDFQIPLQNRHNQGEVLMRLKFMPEFLSSNKRRSGLGATFLGTGVGLVANGGHAIGRAGMAGVGAVAGGALDVTGAVGKGAFKGVGHVGKGVGAIGKGVLGGISSGASAVGLHRRGEGSASHPVQNAAPVPADMEAPTPESDISYSQTAGDHVMSGESGNLTIHVLEADGLLGVDKSGSSDPYVKVRVNGQTVLKTKTKKETLSPNWTESIQVPGLTGNDPVVLNFSVKDHNTIGSDKDLADCDIALWDYIHPAGAAGSNQPEQHHADFWATLGGSGGRLHIALEFEPGQGGGRRLSVQHEGKRGLFHRK